MATETNATRQGAGTSGSSGSSASSASTGASQGSVESTVRNAADKATQKGAEAMDAAGDAMKEGSDRMSGAARRAADYASEAAARAAGDVGKKATGLFATQIAAGADYVTMIADTAESAAAELEDKAPELARMVQDVADRASAFADDLRHHSPEEMLDVAAEFARDNPRLFIGGAVAAGFLLSRFLKSGSAKRARSLTQARRPVRNDNVARRGQGGANA